jgi:hypothetical protein
MKCFACGERLMWADRFETQWQCTRCGFQRRDAYSNGKDEYRRAFPDEAFSNKSGVPWIKVPDGCLLVVSWEEL